MIHEILEILKNIEVFAVKNVFNILSNVKYKLQKNKNITYKIIEAPEFIQKPSHEVTRTFKEPYAEVIDNFVSTMKEKLPEESLNAMYHNLKTLKIGQVNNPIYSFFFGGTYYFGINGITLGNRNRGSATTTHELLHMSSAIIGKNNMAGGFMAGYVGRSLNEGYTEVLNNRLFGHPITKNPLYNTYARFASIIEDIIGKDTMTNMYFSADLKGLFEQLSSYSSKEKTSVFLKDLDSLYQFNGIGFNLSSKRLDRMINYLTDISLNYVNTSIKNGTLTSEDAKLFLQTHREKVTSINTYINQLTNRNGKSSTTQNNNTLNTVNTPQQDMIRSNSEAENSPSHDKNSYSYTFSPNANIESQQLDVAKTKKRVRGSISYYFLFFINIILSILITIGYVFILFK